MSGEMDTSSANGISNIFFLLFVFFLIEKEEKEQEEEHHGVIVFDQSYTKNGKLVVEGDDSESTCRRRLPCSADFTRMGFSVTEDVVDDPGKGGFCGILQAQDGTLIKDPLWVICKYPWLEGVKYGRSKRHWQLSLYRAKAMSLAHEMPQCPLLRPFADAMLRLTNATHNRMEKAARAVFDRWELQKFLSVIKTKLSPYQPTLVGRLFMEESFGINVNEQHAFETRCANAKRIEDLVFDDILLHHCKPLWRVIYADLVRGDEFQSPELFPSTNENNKAIERMLGLMDEKSLRKTGYNLSKALRSCGARE